MNYLLIACTAYLLNSISVLIDKILLVKRLPNPALYVFYISSFSLLVLLAIPFTEIPDLAPFVLGSVSTIAWTFGAYYLFKALKIGDAVRVAPVIGTLIPVILLAMASMTGSINQNEIWAVVILVLGLGFLILPYLKARFSKEELVLEIISALFFANSYFLLKLAYDSSEFLPIFVYSRLIILPAVLLILFIPKLKRLVFKSSGNTAPIHIFSKTGALLFLGQAAGGTSQMLLTFAISLASPAIVNSIQGIQYIFLFFLSLVLARKFPKIFEEKFTALNLSSKIIGIILIFFGLWILSVGIISEKKPTLGVTFSPRYAEELGLNPKTVYKNILLDLNPSLIRLPVYWDEVEKEKGKYDFSKVEDFIKLAQQNKTGIILSLGIKQPRWPECYYPKWAQDLSEDELNREIVNLVQKEVTYFKRFSDIKYWQVENEPFVEFGKCPKPNLKSWERLRMEVSTVRAFDDRPVLITDSGELSTWFDSMRLSDVLGTTLYRTVWSPYFGIIDYPIPPVFYRLKANFMNILTGSKKDVLISELQAEPWPDGGLSISDIYIDRQVELFSDEMLRSNYAYARMTGFDPIIFWGAEWWYFMKENGVPGYWGYAKTIFNEGIYTTP